MRHIGDDQLVGGMPKHMVGVAGGKSAEGGPQTYWRYKPKPQACDKCQAMKDVWFREKPGPVHPNCKCEIEEFKATLGDRKSDGIVAPPGVDLAASIAEAKRVAKECQARASSEVNDFLSGFRLSGSSTISIIRSVCVDELTILFKCLWIYDNFRNGARYDFKQQGKEYEDFGNYHYGLYTRALGVDVGLSRAAAGAAQLAAGTYKLKWYRTWFDDPRDNQMIRKGQAYPFE